MKRFKELTDNEQVMAVNYAARELKAALMAGIIGCSAELSDETIEEYAHFAAEDAFYSEKGDKVIDDIAGEE